MKKQDFAVWQGQDTFVVRAINGVRAIQAVIASHGGAADSYNIAPMDIYSRKVQDKISMTAVHINS